MTHPFLVDQRPYLSRASSSTSMHSSSDSITSSSSSSNASTSSLRTYTTYSEAPSSGTTSQSIRATSRSHSPEVDLDCLRFMNSTVDLEHVFGSVASRGSKLSNDERIRRIELESQTRIPDEADAKVAVRSKKARRFGKLF